jgi:putative oxidoreductase
MPALFVIGRVVFVLYFVFAGLQRLMNVAASAEFIAQRFALPAALSGLAGQIESVVGLSAPQIIALSSGAIEVAAGLLIAFNVGTRVMAGVLVIFTAVSLFYTNAFWTVSGPARDALLEQAVLQISLIGGLLVFMGLGHAQPTEPGRAGSV